MYHRCGEFLIGRCLIACMCENSSQGVLHAQSSCRSSVLVNPERNDGERAMHLVKRVTGSVCHDSVAIRMYSSQTRWHMSLILRRYPALE